MSTFTMSTYEKYISAYPQLLFPIILINTLIPFASLLIALLLTIHHGYKHRPSGEDPLYGIDQYFQLSDVGNFKTFNHEMFVILFTIVGFVGFTLFNSTHQNYQDSIRIFS